MFSPSSEHSLLFTVSHLTSCYVLGNSKVLGPPIHVGHVEPKVVRLCVPVKIDVGKRQQVVARKSPEACHVVFCVSVLCVFFYSFVNEKEKSGFVLSCETRFFLFVIFDEPQRPLE